MAARLRAVGAGGAARAVARRSSRTLRGGTRELRLRARPLRTGPDELRAALGGAELGEALRERALPALPAVARWERSLSDIDGEALARLRERADAVAAHRFDLLGSGPVELGDPIDWSADFKSGRRWPLRHIGRIRDFHFDESDIKVPWELSRFQHLPLLAAAFRATGDRRYLDEIGAQLEHWIDSNPVEMGANWLCTMDVAIRAANWVAALALAAPEAGSQPWSRRAGESLLLHGRFIRSHLEWAEARTNHYLSDVAGLAVVAALFAGGSEGRDWASFAAGELVKEMDHQVRADGCGHEASIPYHRLVTELFVVGSAAAPGAFPDSYGERLDRMLEFVADYTRPDGLAPQIGDADDGRFLPLDDYANADFRSHLHLFEQAGRPLPDPRRASAAYRDGGWYVLRGGDLYAIVRCGDTGVYGRGGHAHNDQLSFELCAGDQPLVVDPGTYSYYEDERLRLGLRSTAAHATLQVDGAEQNELPPYPRFPMGDRTHAELIDWAEPAGRTVFAGRHHGYESLDPPAVHERRIELDAGAGMLLVRDTVESTGAHELSWTFPLAPGCEVSVEEGGAEARFGERRLTVEAAGDVEFRVEEGWYSPSYGVRVRTPYLRARRRSAPGRDETEFRLRVH